MAGRKGLHRESSLVQQAEANDGFLLFFPGDFGLLKLFNKAGICFGYSLLFVKRFRCVV